MFREGFHIVQTSPWPLIGSLSGFGLTVGFVSFFYGWSLFNFLLGVFLTILTMYNWWRDVIRESVFMGYHTSMVKYILRFSVVMFILSEIMFFFSFFWCYFHSSLSPALELGNVWPPVGIFSLDAMGMPLLGTLVLLSSSSILTYSHHSIFLSLNYMKWYNTRKMSLEGLFLSIILGLFFLYIQYNEYLMTSFFVNSSVYGSIFFFATGFHGLHVMLGVIFLMIMFIRMVMYHFSNLDHVGFEGSIWYWHFVDVVWLFLFISVYWWGNKL